jgi:23S rRNA pseudouridine1911/1915/1917 synthase
MNPKIIFEDKELVVLDKPAGMIVNRSDTTKGETTLQDWVEQKLNLKNQISKIPDKPQIQDNNYEEQAKFDFVNRAGIVHRLDKETSGIILVAKTFEAFVNLQAQFKERKVQKTYLALAHGKIEPETGTIDV